MNEQNKKNRNLTEMYLNSKGPIVAIVSLVAALTLGYVILKNMISNERRGEEQAKIEQSIHPTVLNYEGTDSVRIEKRTQRYKLNNKPSEKDIEIVFVKRADDMNNEYSNCEYTSIRAKNKLVYEVGIEKHIFLPDASSILDMTHREIIHGRIKAGNYQAKYEYYKHKLDSIENTLRK